MTDHRIYRRPPVQPARAHRASFLVSVILAEVLNLAAGPLTVLAVLATVATIVAVLLDAPGRPFR